MAPAKPWSHDAGPSGRLSSVGVTIPGAAALSDFTRWKRPSLIFGVSHGSKPAPPCADGKL